MQKINEGKKTITVDGVIYMRWLQLRFDCDTTSIRRPFDGRSTAYQRSLTSQ